MSDGLKYRAEGKGRHPFRNIAESRRRRTDDKKLKDRKMRLVIVLYDREGSSPNILDVAVQSRTTAKNSCLFQRDISVVAIELCDSVFTLVRPLSLRDFLLDVAQ